MRAPENRSDLLAMVALALVSSAAFVNLMAIPAFEDEGTQLRGVWRLIEAHDWLLPLVEGKPLEGWGMVPLALLGGIQPLMAIRAVHVVAGVIGVLLTYVLALRLTGRPTAFIGALLFAICPFAVYLQRFALADILLCTCGLWVLLSLFRLIEAPGWARALTTATALVLAAVCKLPVGFVFLLAITLALLLMPPEVRRPVLPQALAAMAPAAMLAAAITLIAFVRTRQGHVAGFGLQDFFTIGVGADVDIAATIGVAPPTLPGELTAQLTWPIVLLALVGLVASAGLRDWRIRWLLLWGLIPLLGISLLARFWYSRYLLFPLPPLIVCATLGWQRLSLLLPRRGQPAVIAVALVLSVGLLGQQSARLIRDPLTARWSPLDRFQYFQGGGSGYGYPEAARFVASAPDAPAVIYSLDGHSAAQLRNYLPVQWGHRITPVFYGPTGQELRSESQRLQNLLSPTSAWIVIPEPLLKGYLISSFGAGPAEQLNLREVRSFAKPGSATRLGLYDVSRQTP